MHSLASDHFVGQFPEHRSVSTTKKLASVSVRAGSVTRKRQATEVHSVGEHVELKSAFSSYEPYDDDEITISSFQVQSERVLKNRGIYTARVSSRLSLSSSVIFIPAVAATVASAGVSSLMISHQLLAKPALTVTDDKGGNLVSLLRKERTLKQAINGASIALLGFWCFGFVTSIHLVPMLAATISGVGVIGSCAIQLNKIDDLKGKS